MRNVTNKTSQFTLPHHPLTNIELEKYVKLLNLLKFRSVFMRNDLTKKIWKIECGIINLDNKNGPGTAYKKNNDQVINFDSYGNLRPLMDASKYFNSSGLCKILYNHTVYQSYNTFNCGHLCLNFLTNK